MSRDLVLAIDQGTTNTKAVLVDAAGSIVARATRPLAIRFPRTAWVEQDAADLWHSVIEAMAECLGQMGDGGKRVCAIGISNQRESALLWDARTGQPLGPCVVWQCRRSAPLCASLRERGAAEFVRERTGLPLDPLFSAGKIRWLLDRLGPADLAGVRAGTVDAWLLWQLTGGRVHASDCSNASRTQLLNLRSCAWDAEMLELFGIPRSILPQVRPSSGRFGESVAVGPLEAGIPISSLIGDSHAALFAHRAFRPGAVKATYGTGSSLMTPTGEPRASRHGLSSTVAWAQGGRVTYALEGNISVTGSAVEWVGQLLGCADAARGAAELAAQVQDSGGVYLVPAFVGLGAPYWRDEARGLICGLTRATTGAHLARATLESIAFQVRDVLEAMERDSGARLDELLADGGASRNAALMQFQADILGKRVVRADSADLSALGAAWLAGLAEGVWGSLEALEGLASPVTRFEPRIDPGEREMRYQGWRQAVGRALWKPTARPDRAGEGQEPWPA